MVITWLHDAQRRCKAVTVATNTLTKLGVDDSFFAKQRYEEEGVTCAWRAMPLTLQPLPEPLHKAMENIQLVTLTASWQGTQGKKCSSSFIGARKIPDA